MRAAAIAALLLLGGAATRPVGAHEFSPQLLDLSEISTGRFLVTAKSSVYSGMPPEPAFPSGCRTEREPGALDPTATIFRTWLIDCEGGGLRGSRLSVTREGRLEVLLSARFLDGTDFHQVKSGEGRIEFRIPENPRPLSVAGDYLALGVEHILRGPDHLLFVLGLLLLVCGPGALIRTITAFTLGHSLTLTLSVLGWVHVRQSAVEAMIALSLVCLAVEIARGRGETLARKRPAIMAAFFGLLHGLGFAGALREVGLPSSSIPLALASFNLGVEIGQLLFVAAVLAMRSLRWSPSIPRYAAYAIGCPGAFYLFERIIAILADGGF